MGLPSGLILGDLRGNNRQACVELTVIERVCLWSPLTHLVLTLIDLTDPESDLRLISVVEEVELVPTVTSGAEPGSK